MATPEDVLIGVYGQPPDIVGAFMTSYFGAKDFDNKLGGKYKLIYSKVNNIPLRVKIINLGSHPFKNEKLNILEMCHGHIIIYRNEYKNNILTSNVYEGVKAKNIPHLFLNIDGDPAESDFEHFDLIRGLKWIISASYEYKTTRRVMIASQTLVTTHENFVKNSSAVYSLIKQLDAAKELVDNISMLINAVNWEFRETPDVRKIKDLLEKKLDRMTLIKIQEYIDKLTELDTRYRNKDISAELFRAMANQQIRRIFNSIIKYL